MKNQYRAFGITVFGTFAIFAMTLFFISNFSSSYAIPTGVDRSGIPTNTFTSNASTVSTTNYIQNALTASGTSSNFTANFTVPTNYRTSDNSTPLYKLMKNLETSTTEEQFEIIENNPTSINNHGIQYILAHGYNTTNNIRTVFSSGTYGAITDNNIKQYITQIALWLYIYENKTTFASTYCANGGCDFTNSSTSALASATEIRNLINTCGSSQNYQYLKYITLLVDNAKEYSGSEASQLASFSSTSMTYQINEDFTLLVTDAITPSVRSNQDNFLYYSVEIKDPNNYGVYLVDNQSNTISNTESMSGSFHVAVPLQEDLTKMNLSSIEIQVYGHFIRDDGYSYRVTSSINSLVNENKTQKYSDVLYGYTPSEVVGTSFTLYNFVRISKTNITNSAELPGAKLEITKKNDNEWNLSWTSTNKPHYVYLDTGSYTLCETTAPEGFQLNTECIDFEVDGTHIVAVEMKNTPIVPTEDTGLFHSKLFYIIGFLFIYIGFTWMYYFAFKFQKDHNQKRD